MRFRLHLCCLVGLLAAHAAPAFADDNVSGSPGSGAPAAALEARAADSPVVRGAPASGAAAERIVLGLSFALVAGVIVYRLRVDEV